ncbi:MAG: enoyl-CoA hydratase-related protein, partial [Myxococcota bacterium]
PDDELDAEVAKLAGALAERSPTAMRMGLLAYHTQADQRLEESLPFLRGQLFSLLGTKDAQEGLKAFFEKRAPQWSGE